VLAVPDASKQRDPFESSGTTSPATQSHIPGDLNDFVRITYFFV